MESNASDDTEDYDLAWWTASKDVPHPTILLVGKRFSGKSTTAIAVASLYNAPRWAAWCGTKETEDDWAQCFGSSASVYGPDEKGRIALKRIIQYQQRKARYYKKFLKEDFPPRYTVGLAFDDVTAHKQFRKGEILEDLFSNGRHYKSIIIISCQYIKQLPPGVRTNTDYLFMLHTTKNTVEILWKEFVENPEEFRMFLELHRAVTGEKDDNGKRLYNSLVYDNCSNGITLSELFLAFRTWEGFEAAKTTLGCDSWREWNQANYSDPELAEFEKEQRRIERMKRLAKYQEERARRHNSGLKESNDPMDYLSDDSEEEVSSNDRRTCIKGKKGKSIRVSIGPRDRTPPTIPMANGSQDSHASFALPNVASSPSVSGASSTQWSSGSQYSSSPTQWSSGSRFSTPPSSAAWSFGSQFSKTSSGSNIPQFESQYPNVAQNGSHYSNASQFSNVPSVSQYSNGSQYSNVPSVSHYANASQYSKAPSVAQYSNGSQYSNVPSVPQYSNGSQYANVPSVSQFSNGSQYSNAPSVPQYANTLQYSKAPSVTQYSNASQYSNPFNVSHYANASQYANVPSVAQSLSTPQLSPQSIPSTHPSLSQWNRSSTTIPTFRM